MTGSDSFETGGDRFETWPPGGDEGVTSAHDAASELPVSPGAGAENPPETPEQPAEHRGESDTTGENSSPAAGDAPGEPGDEPGGAADRHPQIGPLAPGQGHRRYDWPRIKARYVEGVPNKDAGLTDWPSLDDVARHFGVVPSRVREKSAIEGWVEQRNQYRAQVEAVRRQAKANAMVRNAADLDGKALNAAKMGLQLCIARLTEVGQAAQRSRSESGGTVASGLIDAQEQQRLAQAVDLWHKVGLRAVGDPETHRIELTGANGQPLEIAAELKRDDPNRLAGVLAVLQQAGLGDLFGGGGHAGGPDAGDGRADGEPAALEARR